jgi:hypothetical protein
MQMVALGFPSPMISLATCFFKTYCIHIMLCIYSSWVFGTHFWLCQNGRLWKWIITSRTTSCMFSSHWFRFWDWGDGSRGGQCEFVSMVDVLAQYENTICSHLGLTHSCWLYFINYNWVSCHVTIDLSLGRPFFLYLIMYSTLWNVIFWSLLLRTIGCCSIWFSSKTFKLCFQIKVVS